MTRPPADILAAVALGGTIGSLARYGITVAWPSPYAIGFINVVGCAAIGALLQTLADLPSSHRAHRLARPFVGTGILGGFTTFSTYAVQNITWIRDGQPLTAASYLIGTLVLALAATAAGAALARRWDRP